MSGATPMPATLLVRGALVLSEDCERATPRDLLLRDGRIADIGPPGLTAPDDAERFDAQGFLIIPGMINAHTHSHSALSKGCCDRWSLELLLNALPWINGQRTHEDMELAATINGVEMALKGCTAAYDMYHEFPMPSVEGMAAAARGYEAAGIRALLAPMMSDRLFHQAIPGLAESLPDSLRAQALALTPRAYGETIAACGRALSAERHRAPLVEMALGPAIPLHCTDDFLSACRKLAGDQDLRIHTHLAETKVQALSGERRYGRSLTAHLDRLGLLGEAFTGAHGIWLDDKDLELLARRGATLAHNPLSNLRIGSGLAPVRRMLEHGVGVGIGTDGSNASDSQNMFEAMRQACYLSRLVRLDEKEWLSAPEALRLATSGSARVLGLEAVTGRIATGLAADLVFLDLGHINYIPLNDPVRQLVFCENGGGVRHVMVAGTFVVRDGQPARVKLDELGRKAAQTVQRLNDITADQRDLAENLETYVSAYCLGLKQRKFRLHRTLTDE